MSSNKLPECSLIDCITESDARTKFVQQNLNNLAVILLMKSCERTEKKVEAPKPKSKRGRKPKPNPKVKKAEKEEYKHIIEVFRKWNKTHDVTSICSCGTCKFCKINESVKNCTSKKVETKKKTSKGAVEQQEFVQCEVCDWPDDLQELLHDWDTLPEISDTSNMSNGIEKYMAEHNKSDMFDLYAVEDVPVKPVKKSNKTAKRRVSKPPASRKPTKKSGRRGQPKTGRVGRNSLKYRKVHCGDPTTPSTQNNENSKPMENENSVQFERTELNSKSDTLSTKDVINKVSVEFTKCLPYDILQLRPTLAENYEKAKASDYFLNTK